MTEPITPHLTPEQIEALQLGSGKHEPGAPDPCLLELESMFSGEPFSDSPACVDPVLAAFGRAWNDLLPTADRQELKARYTGKLAGTNRGPALSAKRSFMALDWMWRVHAPLWFAEVPELAEHAAALRALAPITAELGEDERTAAIALVGEAAWAAWDSRAAWAATSNAALTAAFEAAKGCATYEEALAKAYAVFEKHRAAVRGQLHTLFTDMINAELREVPQ